MPTAVINALAALTEGDWDRAAEAARLAAAQHPDGALAAALAEFLGDLTTPGVYDEPSAFEAFIDNGANPGLYRRTIQGLSEIHDEHRPSTVLDIGCGDGRVTAGVLSPSTTTTTTRVDLVEPSAELLALAVDAADRPGLEVVGHGTDVAGFLAELDDDARWDLVQSTFALHAIQPHERLALFRALTWRTSVLVVVEFDVPAFRDRSPEHLAYLADRYEDGIREYPDHPEVIANFLMPVLVGQLDPTRPRYTFEQPIERWTDLMHEAGFTTSTRPVATYWWANATLILATSP